MTTSSNKGLIIGIFAAAVLIFGGLIWAVATAPPASGPSGGSAEEALSFSDDNAPAVGPKDAKVVVHMYGDFQCPACRSAEPGVKYAIDTYRDRVRFVWKDFPLTQIHPNAELAANAARCAETQGKFWEYHDALYASQPEWADERDPSQKFAAYAKDVGLNTDAFSSCLSARAQKAKVGADVAEGFRNSVDATPTFFINNRRYFGMSPTEWAKQLDQALAVRP